MYLHSLKRITLSNHCTVEIIPAGISLDYVAELRSKRANGPKKGDLGSENTGMYAPSACFSLIFVCGMCLLRLSHLTTAMIPTKQKPKAPNVFHFLNTALANPAPRGVASSAPKNEGTFHPSFLQSHRIVFAWSRSPMADIASGRV